MDDTLIIEPRFNGPRLSGNGGYVGGVMAGRFTERSAATARSRSPCARRFRSTAAAGRARGRRADAARRRHADLRGARRLGDAPEPPPAPTDWDDVMRRGEDGGSPEDSDFTWCVVCGRKRGVGDGLRVFGTSGPQPGYSLSCYLPHANHADGEGRIRPEFVWGTLDCPGAFAAQDIDDMRPALTGRMTARVIEPPKVGERCAVVGWKIGEEGRKLYSGTALYTESGRLCAIGTCTWIVLKELDAERE